MTNKRVESVEAKITPEEAVTSAIEFARANGVAVFGCGGLKHTTEADYRNDLGVSPGHGTYLVELLGESFADGNRHYLTGEPLRDIALMVWVNDQTGEAKVFASL